MRIRLKGGIAIATVVSLSIGVAPTQATLTCTGSWTVVRTPTPGEGGQLLGVTAIAPDDLWAVGHYHPSGGGNATLAIHWNGARWSVVPTPTPGEFGLLHGVDAAASDDVWAAGDFDGGVMHWDGANWTITPIPLPPGVKFASMRDVAAIASDDVWAVGFRGGRTLVEHWDGSSWSIVPSPSAGRRLFTVLFGVAARSPTDVWGTGLFTDADGIERPFAIHWDGFEWTSVPVPSPGGGGSLLDADPFGTSPAWAAGTKRSGGSLIERLRPDGWQIVPDAGLDHLNGVDALSRMNAWAVGAIDGGPGIEHWNGSSWTMETLPTVQPGENGLDAVVALSPTNVWAVGDRGGPGDSLRNLTLHFC